MTEAEGFSFLGTANEVVGKSFDNPYLSSKLPCENCINLLVINGILERCAVKSDQILRASYMHECPDHEESYFDQGGTFPNMPDNTENRPVL